MTFGRYELLFRLATGGMAQLHVGRLQSVDDFEKLVVIKRIHSAHAENSSFVKMFIDEARLVARISHPNVAQVIELGKAEDVYFIAMEYVNGESLEALFHRVRLPLTLCARIIADAAAGLHAAHSLRSPEGELLHVVHRDVSPANVLISYDGVVKVTDFGVARARSNAHKTQVGVLKGKYAYMAPEYLKHELIDARSDIFGLGVVLYEISTLQRLFKSSDDTKTMQNVIKGEILPPSLIIEGYPPSLEAIVLKALRRNPEARFQTALEMQTALEQFIVESGVPALHAELGDLMQETFADRIQKKRELLSEVQASPPDAPSEEVPVVHQEHSRSSTLKGAVPARVMNESPSVRKARNYKIVFISSGLLLSVAVVLLAVVLLLPAPMPDRTAAASSAASQRTEAIEITVKIRPRSAILRVDGKRVSNPFKLRRKPAKGEMIVTATSPGYISQMIKVQLDRSGHWDVDLAPDATLTSAAERPEPVVSAAPKPEVAPVVAVEPKLEPTPAPRVRPKPKPRPRVRPRPKPRPRPRVKPRPKSKPRPRVKPRPKGKPRSKPSKDGLFGNPFK